MAEMILKICLLINLILATYAVKDRYYPRYHLAPPYGWMNDPNGFSIYNDEYHLFYQFNPNSSLEAGIAHWGHAKSEDLINWEHLPIAMYPNNSYDISGVFSGSAIVEDGKMYLYYTGNINHPNENPDHEQHQNLATSDDGVTFTKYPGNPIIVDADHEPNFRDPKVWKHEDKYYMILGNSFQNDSFGRALLYSSEDRISWKEASVIYDTDGELGFMFECPDFFELDGRFVLLFSPQGIKPHGDNYQNLYQTGYVVGDFDYETNKFTPLTKFTELDHGHDFYATQTLEDDNGRRVMVAWFDMWEQDYPEREDGFTGQMTIPRVLSLTKDNHLIQRPIREIKSARGNKLHSGRADGSVVTLEDKAGEVIIKGRRNRNIELIIEGGNATVNITYDHDAGTITLDRGGEDGVRRTEWKPRGKKVQMTIYIDASSIEVFCGKGEVTFSSRFFPNGPVQVKLSENKASNIKVYNMERTVPKPN